MSSLKYVVYVTSAVETQIDGGCYIGEGRWERNVLDALVKDGRETYVVDLNSKWNTSLEKPKNLYDYSELKSLDNSVFISHSPPMRLDIPVKAQRYILQWFNGPDDNADTEFLEFEKNNPNSVVATYNFAPKIEKYKRFGEKNIEWVQGPAVPEVWEEHKSFSEEYLLWSSKVLYNFIEGHSIDGLLTSIFQFCSDALNSDVNLKVAFLLGTAGPFSTSEEISKWFWSSKVSSPIRKYKERVEFISQVEWFEVFDVLRKTRLIISPHMGFGGPPYESAAFGIPMVLMSNGHPFMDMNYKNLFPEILTIKNANDNSFVNILQDLSNNKELYEKTGNAYRNYVKVFGTYKGYLNQLDKVCRKRGWV
jgi:hypothetical protein